MRVERRPDERYNAALRSPVEPQNPYEAALWHLLKRNVNDDTIIRVVDAYEDTFERETLQAWIIAGASDEDLTTRLHMSPEMIAPYRHLCCNPMVFRDKLELLRWVRLYQGTREGELLLQRAVVLDGVEAVADLCGLATKLDAAHVNEQIMRATYFRGISTLSASRVSGANAVAAHNLLKSSMVAGAATQKRGTPDLHEIILKLKHRELTFQADEDIPRGEILN